VPGAVSGWSWSEELRKKIRASSGVDFGYGPTGYASKKAYDLLVQ
jgi:hypothetical protein